MIESLSQLMEKMRKTRANGNSEVKRSVNLHQNPPKEQQWMKTLGTGIHPMSNPHPDATLEAQAKFLQQMSDLRKRTFQGMQALKAQDNANLLMEQITIHQMKIKMLTAEMEKTLKAIETLAENPTLSFEAAMGEKKKDNPMGIKVPE